MPEKNGPTASWLKPNKEIIVKKLIQFWEFFSSKNKTVKDFKQKLKSIVENNLQITTSFPLFTLYLTEAPGKTKNEFIKDQYN